MNYLVFPGVLLAMTACSANPPKTPAAPSYAADRDRVQPSPIDFPAEIDPPPPVAPGSETPNTTPPNSEPKRDERDRP